MVVSGGGAHARHERLEPVAGDVVAPNLIVQVRRPVDVRGARDMARTRRAACPRSTRRCGWWVVQLLARATRSSPGRPAARSRGQRVCSWKCPPPATVMNGDGRLRPPTWSLVAASPILPGGGRVRSRCRYVSAGCNVRVMPPGPSVVAPSARGRGPGRRDAAASRGNRPCRRPGSARGRHRRRWPSSRRSARGVPALGGRGYAVVAS